MCIYPIGRPRHRGFDQTTAAGRRRTCATGRKMVDGKNFGVHLLLPHFRRQKEGDFKVTSMLDDPRPWSQVRKSCSIDVALKSRLSFGGHCGRSGCAPRKVRPRHLMASVDFFACRCCLVGTLCKPAAVVSCAGCAGPCSDGGQRQLPPSDWWWYSAQRRLVWCFSCRRPVIDTVHSCTCWYIGHSSAVLLVARARCLKQVLTLRCGVRCNALFLFFFLALLRRSRNMIQRAGVRMCVCVFVHVRFTLVLCVPLPVCLLPCVVACSAARACV